MQNQKIAKFVLATMLAAGVLAVASAGWAQPGKIMAQKVVEEVKAAHPEITGLEVAATRSASEGCKTIAATEAGEVGQKCDKDELTAIRTNKPFVEQEKNEFDVTLPIHDSGGKIIATAGMDFKVEAGRTQIMMVREAQRVEAVFSIACGTRRTVPAAKTEPAG